MMNEARIGVGLGATALGYTGYLHVARLRPHPPAGPPGRRRRTRRRRRCRSSSTPTSGGCCWRRSPTSRAALALVLYCARLVDEEQTAETEDERARGAPAARRAHPDRQELAVAVVPGGQRPRDPGARRLRLHPRLRRSSSSTATTGSTRSTRAPTASRASTCSAARSSCSGGAGLRAARRDDRRHRRRGRRGGRRVGRAAARSCEPPLARVAEVDRRRCGAPATRTARWPTRRSTWRRSGTRGGVDVAGAGARRRRAATATSTTASARRRGTSSATSCRGPARSSTCWRAWTARPWRPRPTGSDAAPRPTRKR